MRRVHATGRSVMRLAYLAAGVALLGVLAMAAVYEERGREAFRQSARAEAQDRLGLLRSDLQGVVNAHSEVVRALAGVVRYQPDIDQAQFERLGAELIAGLPSIRNVAAAPDLVIRMVYPLEPNRMVLGLDYRAVPGAGRGGRAGARRGRDGAGGAGGAAAGRARLHRAGAGLPRRRRHGSEALLGRRFGGDRRGGALPRERARRPALRARRGVGRARRAGRRRATLLRRPGGPWPGPDHHRGQPAFGRVAAGGGARRAGGALRRRPGGRAPSSLLGGPADRRADHRRGTARRGAPGEDGADPRPRGRAFAPVLAARVRAGGVGKRGLGRGSRHRHDALGRADQAALRLQREGGAFQRGGLGERPSPRRPGADRRGGERRRA